MCWKKLLTLWGRRGPFIGLYEKEPLQETYPEDSGLNQRFRGHSGVSPAGQQSRATRSTKKQKFQTGDSGLGPETPAYRKTAKTAKRKLQ